MRMQSLKAYEKLQQGAKLDAANIYGTSAWYFRNLLQTVEETKKEFWYKALDAIEKASMNHYNRSYKANNEIQRITLSLKEEL